MKNKTEGRKMRGGVMLSTQGHRLSHLKGLGLWDGAARCLKAHLVLHCGQRLRSAGETSPPSNQRQRWSVPPIRAEQRGGTKGPVWLRRGEACERLSRLGNSGPAGGAIAFWVPGPSWAGAGLESRFRGSSSSMWLMLSD